MKELPVLLDEDAAGEAELAEGRKDDAGDVFSVVVDDSRDDKVGKSVSQDDDVLRIERPTGENFDLEIEVMSHCSSFHEITYFIRNFQLISMQYSAIKNVAFCSRQSIFTL